MIGGKGTMDIKHLQTLHAIISHGSYLKAAESLGYVQSTITLHIQQLEEEFGVRLFEKNGRRMILSQDGQVFWEQARPMMDQMESIKKAMFELKNGSLGQVRVGVIENFFKTSMSPVIMEFCRDHPRVKLSLEFGGMVSISQRVLQDELDIGICPKPAMDSGLHFVPLKIETLKLLLPVGHPLSLVETITPEHLNAEEILLTEPVCVYRKAVEKGFEQVDLSLRPRLEIGDVGSLIQFVQQGLGIAFLPASALHLVPQGTIVRSVEGLLIQTTIGLVRQSRLLGTSGEKLYTYLLEHLSTSTG